MERGTLERQKLTDHLVELEREKAELTAQADAAHTRIQSQENSIQSLGSQILDHQGEINRLESSLQSELGQRRLDRDQIEALEKEITELTLRLGAKSAEQQRGRLRESELEYRILQQRNELAEVRAAIAAQEKEVGRLNATIADLTIVESALCARVREITNQHEAASMRIHELESKTQAAAHTIQSRDQELAGLRHSVLDAARVGYTINRARIQADGQMVDSWKGLIGALLETPLSNVQRGLVNEIVCALGGWKKGRMDFMSAHGGEFQVEPLELHHTEFDCAEVVEDALEAVRRNAEQAGAIVRAEVVGPVPQTARGAAPHIHRLITMLASSLWDLGKAEHLRIEVSFDAPQDGDPEMRVSFLLSPTNSSEENACARLSAIVENSASFEALRCRGSELALTSACQLALALGGSPSFETTSVGETRVSLALPLSRTHDAFLVR
jgi:cell division protein FtsL